MSHLQSREGDVKPCIIYEEGVVYTMGGSKDIMRKDMCDWTLQQLLFT